MDIKTLDQIKDQFYGPEGTPERDRIENELQALRIGLKIRAAREKLCLTQEELAQRVGKKRSFISKVENDGGNITLKTLYEIVEHGLTLQDVGTEWDIFYCHNVFCYSWLLLKNALIAASIFLVRSSLLSVSSK